MAGKYALTAMAAFAILAGCQHDRSAASRFKPNGSSETVEGLFRSGEHASFRVDDGRVFELLMPNREEQRIMTPFIAYSGEAPICVSMRLSGKPGPNPFDVGNAFKVSRIYNATRVACPE